MKKAFWLVDIKRCKENKRLRRNLATHLSKIFADTRRKY